MSYRGGDRGRGRGRGGGSDRGSRGGRGGGGDRGSRGGRGGDFRGGRGAPQAVEVYRQQGGVPEPSRIVRALEDQTFKDTLSLQSLTIQPSFPQRPGHGTRGRPVILWSNYFELVLPKSQVLYRYNVDIAGVSKSKEAKKAKWILQLLLEQSLNHVGPQLVTDFSSTIVSCVDLNFEDEAFIVTYRNEGEDLPQAGARTYTVHVQSTGTLELSDLVDFVTSSNISEAATPKDDLVQALNIIIGHHPKASDKVFSTNASKHFLKSGDMVEKFGLGGGLEAFRGFFSSVRAATARILVNVQVKHAACYEAIPLDIMMDKFPTRDLHRLESFLKTVRVLVTHLKRKNPQAKTIAGLANKSDGRRLENPPRVPVFGASSDKVQFFLTSPTTDTSATVSGRGRGRGGKKVGNRGGQPLFPREEASTGSGKYISVQEYFKQTYGALTKPHLPCLNVGNKDNPNYLPPEVCTIVSGTPYRRQLGPSQTAAMIENAVRRPNINAHSIATRGFSLINGNNTQVKAFGLSMAPSLVTVQGRLLDSPTPRYRNGRTARADHGSWNMRDIQFSEAGGKLTRWSYVWISVKGQRDAWDDRNELMKRFHAILNKCGVNASEPMGGNRIELEISSQGLSLQDEAKLDQMFARAENGQVPYMLVILPKDDAAIYNRVKILGDIRHGIHTTCVLGYKFAKRSDRDPENSQYLANVALKVNLKLGGINQKLEGVRLGVIDEGKTMVVGLDVTHPSPGSASDAPSVAALVSSIDKFLAQWPASIRIQESRKEMVSDVCTLFKEALNRWQGQPKSKPLPENILLYRDGVSEGQYNIVLEKELPEIRKACEETYPASDTARGIPYLSIVIVGKRHNTRFYPTATEAADRSGNPQNGTVVDRGVTEVRNWDFFLQAHTALQGTARPAHYYVIHDEIFRRLKVKAPFENTADMLEDLTHNMCYVFGRATKAVSICPPAYYADLVCDRARRWLGGVFEMSSAGSTAGGDGASEGDVRVHDRLKDTMFYI